MDAELERNLIDAFGLSIEEEASMIAEVAFSVVRDRAVSSLYGYQASRSNGFPEISDVFKSPYDQRVAYRLESKAFGFSSLPLYSGAGDLLGQLSRLLMVCKERTALSSYIERANGAISRLGAETNCMDDVDYIRHLRNAIMHCRYEVRVDAGDYLQTKISFLDLKSGGSKVSGLITFSPEQLNKVIDILIDMVCLQYLEDIGWVFDDASGNT